MGTKLESASNGIWTERLWRSKQEGHTDLETEAAARSTTMGPAHVDEGAECLWLQGGGTVHTQVTLPTTKFCDISL